MMREMKKKKNGGGQEWDRYLFSKSIAIQHTKRTGWLLGWVRIIVMQEYRRHGTQYWVRQGVSLVMFCGWRDLCRQVSLSFSQNSTLCNVISLFFCHFFDSPIDRNNKKKMLDRLNYCDYCCSQLTRQTVRQTNSSLPVRITRRGRAADGPPSCLIAFHKKKNKYQQKKSWQLFFDVSRQVLLLMWSSWWKISLLLPYWSPRVCEQMKNQPRRRRHFFAIETCQLGDNVKHVSESICKSRVRTLEKQQKKDHQTDGQHSLHFKFPPKI